MADQVSVEISIEEKAALQALTRLSKGIEGVEQSAKKSLDKTDVYFANLAATITTKLASTALGAASKGMEMLVSAFNSGIDAAQVQEDAVNKLNAQLALTGDYSAETSQELQDFASKLQSVSKFGDETILSQLALAQAMGANVQQSKQIVAAAADMSQALGISLDSAVRNLSGTLGGQIGLMGRSVPALRNLTEEQLRSGQAIELVAQKFSGQATAAIKTYSGAMAQAKNTIGDTTEQLGFLVTKSPVVIAGINAVGKIFANLGNVINENSDVMRSFAEDILLKTLIFGIEAAVEGTNLLIKGFNFTRNAIDAAVTYVYFLAESYVDFFATVVSGVSKMQEFFGVSSEGARNLAAEMRQLADDFSGAQKMMLDGIEERMNNEDVLVEKLREIKTKSIAIVNEEVNSARAAKDQIQFVNQEKIKNEEMASRQMIEARKTAMAELQALQIEAELAAEEKRIMMRDVEGQRTEEELARLQEIERQKLEIKFQAEEEKAKLIEDSQKREVELQKIKYKEQIALDQLELKQAQDKAKQKRLIEDSMIQATQNFIQAGTMLTKKGSAENQALQIANAIINTYAAANKALASAPPPFNIALAASQVALGLANVAQIKRQSFYSGGVVGGYTGATAGKDNTIANVRTGEMILNASQQKNMFDFINQGGGNNNNELVASINRLASVPVVVNMNNREIARAVREARLEGYSV